MLIIKELSKVFTMHVRGGARITSFSDVSLETRGGELLAVTGPSGAGKSSLLKCVYRTYLPTSGSIMYTSGQAVHSGRSGRPGRTVNLAEADEWEILRLRRAEIGYVSQFFHVTPRTPALEILTEPLTARGMDGGEAEETARYMLFRAGLDAALWDMYPSTFSGGEKQRLNILRAIITRPRLLLLDEPTASLDAVYKRQVVEMLSELKAAGTAMLGVFHDRDAMLALSDRRYDMKLGEYCPVDREIG